MPTPINLKVLDLSHHNTVTDFAALFKFGIRGIIHKATQGSGNVDNTYKDRRQKALDAGLLWGAYHFADGSDPDAQVDHFLKNAALGPHDLGALDYEPLAGSTMTLSSARRFLQRFLDKTGKRAVLYSGNLIKETLGNNVDAFLGGHRLWLAQYGPAPKVPPAWKGPWLWQFSDGNINNHGIKVPGITGFVDLNSFAGDEAQLSAEWVK